MTATIQHFTRALLTPDLSLATLSDARAVTDRNGKPWSATTPTLTAVQAPVTAIDLSRDGTANCYIVSEAGDYMFDAAVRGNGSGDDAAIALADGMKADWLWVTKGLEQEISAVSLDAGKGRIQNVESRTDRIYEEIPHPLQMRRQAGCLYRQGTALENIGHRRHCR